MLDIRMLREEPENVRENIKKRFQEDKLQLVDDFLKKDEQYRQLLKQTEQLRAERNIVSKEINELKKAGKDATNALQKAKEIPQQINKIEEKLNTLKEAIDTILKTLPNILHESVPIGKDASENVVKATIGEPTQHSFPTKSHAELAEQLEVADFETASEISGNGFYILKGDLALLNAALINFSRDYMTQQGYTYYEPPLMIREEVLKGVYSADEIAQMSYKIDGEDLFLIATSEHPLIGMFINKTIPKEKLPIKITGFSACFRKEIGSHGIDEKGLYRTHQFNKQEMIVICHPDDSYTLYEEMLTHSKELFKTLGIPIREIECCSGDLASLKAKSADLEAWSPRKKDYFEITSCTNMEAAQARRLNIKIKEGNEKYHAHTLNNTAIATSRAMVAILENFQEEDGSIRIPKALQPYMGGKTHIGK